jgi:hypothetical protein
LLGNRQPDPQGATHCQRQASLMPTPPEALQSEP